MKKKIFLTNLKLFFNAFGRKKGRGRNTNEFDLLKLSFFFFEIFFSFIGAETPVRIKNTN